MSIRINKYIAQASGLSRREADRLIISGNVLLNGQVAKLGDSVSESDSVKLNQQLLTLPSTTTTIIFNKPKGYISSRSGQGSLTIYDLLPNEFHSLKTVGRLDKDSKGLLILTNDGSLAYELTHPKYHKQKLYNVTLDKPLKISDQKQISVKGVQLDDGQSKLELKMLDSEHNWQVIMHEGRNRQIRRTFQDLGYNVLELKRLSVAGYNLGDLIEGQYRKIS